LREGVVATLEESKEEDATTLNAIFEMYLLLGVLDVVCLFIYEETTDEKSVSS